MIARALFLALLLCWPLAATAQVAVPPLSGRVVDQTATLSAGDIDALTQRLKDLETRKGSQVAVLIVPTTQPESIEQFAIRVAEAWKIGRKKVDDGALLVVAKNDHRLRIESGYGLEGALTDITSRRIIDEIIVPHFRTGDFAGGISAGVDRMIRVIDGEPLPAPKPEATHNVDPALFNIVFSPFGLLGYAAIAAMMRGLLGRLLGSGVTAGIIGAVMWLLLGSIVISSIFGIAAFFVTMFGDAILAASQQASRNARRGGYGGGWSSGSSSGSWSSGSSSGSSDGGFSGGGGSFGGGGASGSW